MPHHIPPQGNIMPLKRGAPANQEKSHTDPKMSVKNPDHEAENPAPMPRAQQGQGGSPADTDPQGHQGGIPRQK